MNTVAEKLSDSEDGTGETLQSTTLRDKEIISSVRRKYLLSAKGKSLSTHFMRLV